MRTIEPDTHPMEDPEGQLENALIEAFLQKRGLDMKGIRALPEDEACRVLTEASVHAAAKLAEVEARARFVQGLHGEE
jgi:hypothetical protein